MTQPTCKLDYCDRAATLKGLCRGHYSQQWRGAEFTPLRHRNSGKPCRFPGCPKTLDGHAAQGLCQSHYRHWRQFGNLEPTRGKNAGLRCAKDGCEKALGVSDARGLCGRHYSQWRTDNGPRCTIDNCSRVIATGGLCQRHFKRKRSHGDPHHKHPVKVCLECDQDFRPSVWRQVVCRACVREHTKKRRDSVRYAQTDRDMRRLLSRFRNACAYCGGSLTAGMHLDHVWPVSRGGVTGISNIVPACVACNLSKSNKSVMEWRVWKLNRAA